jgi:hypothetical protein
VSRLDEILQRKITRKQFLLSVFALFGAVIGLPSILGILTKGAHTHNENNTGYGRQHYGS